MKTKNKYKERVDKYAEYVPISFGFKPLYSHSSIRFLIEEKDMPEGYKVGKGLTWESMAATTLAEASVSN